MLASTVQFSNNDQPPITPSQRLECTGAGTEDPALRSCPQTPNSVPDTIPLRIHVPRRSSTSDPSSRSCRVVNVPPMSNQCETFARMLASGLPKQPRSAP
jgi:hypothetical protein